MYSYFKESIVILLLVLSSSMFSQETVTKKIEQTFPMTNTGELYLENKYGNVTITGWEQNSIQIVIDIKASNKKQEKANLLLERIVPKFRTTDDYVSVISEISEKNTSLFSRYWKKVNPFETNKGNVSIDYTVYLPVNAEIEIVNKFGDVIIENWTGKLKATIEHGDLWVNESVVNANIDMKFGKLRAKSMSYGNIKMKNGSIDAENFQDLVLATSGTDIEIDSVNSLQFTSSKDEVVFDHVGSIEGEIKFSNVQINELNKAADLYLKVADFRVSKVLQKDAEVTIEQESSDININISELAFKFEATLEQGLLRLARSFTDIESNVLNESKRIRNIKASYGDKPAGEFLLKGKKGIITLKE